VVVDKGRIMAEGSPAALIRQYASREVLEVRFGADRNESTADVVRPFAERIEVLPDRILLYTEDGEAALMRLQAAGLVPKTSLVRRASLEDVFLRLTGRSLIE
jgi:lipooligosaccharide transport system ATP-binding protein